MKTIAAAILIGLVACLHVRKQFDRLFDAIQLQRTSGCLEFPPDGLYRVSAVHSGKCLEVGGKSDLYQAECNNDLRQIFAVTLLEVARDCSWAFVDLALSLEPIQKIGIRSLSMMETAPIHLISTINPLPLLLSVTEKFGEFSIAIPHSGQVLDVEAESHTDGARIIQYPYRRQRNQHWKFDSPVEHRNG